MSFITGAKHRNLICVMSQAISLLEEYSTNNHITFEKLVSIKKDRDILISISVEFDGHLEELRSLAKKYLAIEKRARADLRREKLLLKKGQSMAKCPVN
jgi:hypothetical protein